MFKITLNYFIKKYEKLNYHANKKYMNKLNHTCWGAN
jgi:hypothetical protein